MTVAAGFEIPAFVVDGVSAEKMKTYAAILRDPNPIHWDRTEVAAAGHGDRLINQGPTNLGYVMTMLMNWAGPEAIRMVRTRFTSNVFEDDVVTAGGVVTDVRSEDGELLADCEVWLDRADGTRAVAGTATVIVGST